jgi:hypothetical protein
MVKEFNDKVFYGMQPGQIAKVENAIWFTYYFID